MTGRAEKARLYSRTDLAEGELHQLGLGLAAIFSTRSPGSPNVSEDAAALIPFDERRGLLVVADGCGGMPSGDQASEIAVTALRNAARMAVKKGLDLRSAVLDGIERADREIQALGVGAGTTIAVAELDGLKLRPYHVGDSQIMVIGQKGKVKHLTKCHSPVGYAQEAGILSAKEALTHVDRHVISNWLGKPGMHLEMGPVIELTPKDTVIVASDGLFDNLREQEIVEACRKGQLLAVSRALAETCHMRMTNAVPGRPSKPDDLTFIAFRRRFAVG